MKFLAFLTGKQDSRTPSSEFSRFFREASSGEKKRVFLDVARKASADQQKIIESIRPMQTSN